MILFPFFNPTYFVSRFIIRTLVQRLMLPNSINIMFSSLFSLSNIMISSVGFIPTLRTLNSIRRIIYNFDGRIRTSSVTRIFRSLDTANLNPLVQENIRRTVITCLRDYLKYSQPVSKMFYILLTSIIFKSVKIFLFYTLKYILVLVLFSLGIFWNETLYGIKIFKRFSNYIVSILENYFSFNLPRPIGGTGVNTRSNYINSYLNLEPEVETEPKNSNIKTIGLILLGTVGIILGVAIVDHNYPNVFSNIPVVHTASEQIFSAFDLIYNSIKYRIYGQGVELPNPEQLPRTELYPDPELDPLAQQLADVANRLPQGPDWYLSWLECIEWIHTNWDRAIRMYGLFRLRIIIRTFNILFPNSPTRTPASSVYNSPTGTVHNTPNDSVASSSSGSPTIAPTTPQTQVFEIPAISINGTVINPNTPTDVLEGEQGEFVNPFME